MRTYRFTRPHSVLQRAKLDNLALVPASLLPFKAKWQAMTNGLPQGTVLVVLPRTNGTARQSAETVVQHLRSEGRRVTVLGAEGFVAQKNATGGKSLGRSATPGNLIKIHSLVSLPRKGRCRSPRPHR